VEINCSEQSCMTNVVPSESQGKRVSEVQAIVAKCRQISAAAAATAMDAFRHECSGLSAQADSSTKVAIVAATAESLTDFWANLESSAAAVVSETAALLPTQGPDKTTRTIENTCGDRTSSINRYFEQLTT
jgi:hypothetical protein